VSLCLVGRRIIQVNIEPLSFRAFVAFELFKLRNEGLLMKKLFALVIGYFLLITVAGCLSAKDKSTTATLKIYFSNDFQGYLEPCG
jgi:hypothetical protein